MPLHDRGDSPQPQLTPRHLADRSLQQAQFYQVTFRKKVYRGIDELQRDLDAWLAEYNEVRSHQGRWCYGKTPMQTFLVSLPLAQEKLLQAH